MQGWPQKIRQAPVTVSLVVLTVAVFVLEVIGSLGGGTLGLSRWALSGEALMQGWWWTLWTHLFLHGNLLHLAVNVLAIWFMGPEVERALGAVRYLTVYFVSGIAGGLLQTAFAPPNSELIGASGAVCGVLLSFTTMYPEMPLRALLFFVIPVNMKARTLGWGLVVVSLLAAIFRVFPQIGHLAHLGGAVAGAGLTWWWLRGRRPVRSQRGNLPTEELLQRVLEEGIDGLDRDELRQLEELAAARECRQGRHR